MPNSRHNTSCTIYGLLTSCIRTSTVTFGSMTTVIRSLHIEGSMPERTQH